MHSKHILPQSTATVSKSTTNLTIISNNNEQQSPQTSDTEYDKITIGHIKDFIHHHKIQVGANEAYLRSSRKLLDIFELDFKRLLSGESVSNNMKSKYTAYKSELYDSSDQFSSYLEDLKAKVIEELEDEEGGEAD